MQPVDKNENKYTDIQNINQSELIERRDAELQFISCAYKDDEAWYNTISNDTDNSNDDEDKLLMDHNRNNNDFTDNSSSVSTTVYRRLRLDKTTNLHNDNASINLCIILSLSLPIHYPIIGCITVSGKLEEYYTNDIETKNNNNNSETVDRIRQPHQQYYTNPSIWNIATKSLNDLLQKCQEVSNSLEGTETIFSIFSIADEWIDETWNNIILYQKELKYYKLPASQPSSQVTQHQDDDDESERKKEEDLKTIDIILCRMVLYSHHIISKVKRADILSLTKNDYQLSGYCKIGWPGIIIIEGQENDCVNFYNTIRRWTWQYLVRRGEEIENYTLTIPSTTVTATKQNLIETFINTKRLLPPFSEVDDISIVASYCRSVGLESLFLTSMKVYNNTKDTDTNNTNNNGNGNSNSNKVINTNTDDNIHKSAITTTTTSTNKDNTKKKLRTKKKNNMDKQFVPVTNSNNNDEYDNDAIDSSTATSASTCYYGCLVHVDHMNDVKNYYKWLQSTCIEYNVQLLMKHCYPTKLNDNSDNNTTATSSTSKKRPKIFVLLLGIRMDDIRLVLKSWRSTKVDIDSKGKLCYERMMSVLIEGKVILALDDITKLVLSCNDDKGNGGQQVVVVVVATTTTTQVTVTDTKSTNIRKKDDTIQNESNILFASSNNSHIYSTYNNIIDLAYMIGGQSWKDCILPILYPSS